MVNEIGIILKEAEDMIREIDVNQFREIKDGKLYLGNNLSLMKSMYEEICSDNMDRAIDLIYMDPPFFSKADYKAKVDIDGKKIEKVAYTDRWGNGLKEYLTMLTARLILAKALMKDSATVWVHLDWHGVHYVKILMDEIFGSNHFVNEIIWQYKSGGSTNKRFARKHDTILVYSKTSDYIFNPIKEKSYNRNFKPYGFKGVEEFQDEKGWYTLVNMKDVWNIDMVGRTSRERTGYPTQKPKALLERIIFAATNEGGTVADFFCGSGTTLEVAKEMKRKFIGIDLSQIAIECTLKRLWNI